MIKLRLEAPWYTYQKKLAALFEQDPDVTVADIYEGDDDDADFVIDIEVSNHEKFVALDRVMPSYKTFGNVTVEINLYDEENLSANSEVELYKTIFKDNPIVQDITCLIDNVGVCHPYVCFKPEVIQFFDDDLTDVNGNYTGLAEDIAREVFEDNMRGINFCTAAKNANVAKPLGEWP